MFIDEKSDWQYEKDQRVLESLEQDFGTAYRTVTGMCYQLHQQYLNEEPFHPFHSDEND